jgi:hypothetical protein
MGLVPFSTFHFDNTVHITFLHSISSSAMRQNRVHIIMKLSIEYSRDCNCVSKKKNAGHSHMQRLSLQLCLGLTSHKENEKQKQTEAHNQQQKSYAKSK